MKTKLHPRLFGCSAARGFISAQAAIVLAAITGSAGLLAYEWHRSRSGKGHHNLMRSHHHKPDAKTASTN